MAYIYNLTDTWDNGGTTWNGIKLNVTDTASASGSNLLDLQVGGTSQFLVGKTGATVIGGTLQSKTVSAIIDYTALNSLYIKPATYTNSTGTELDVVGTSASFNMVCTGASSESYAIAGSYAMRVSTDTAGSYIEANGLSVSALRDSASDVGTAGYLTSLNISAQNRPSLNGSAVTPGAWAVYSTLASNAGTITSAYAGTFYISSASYSDVNATVTTAYNLYTLGNARRVTGTTGTGTITTYYDAYLGGASTSTGGTVTNKWGLYQASATHNNYFAGKVGIGTSPTYLLEIYGGSGNGRIEFDIPNPNPVIRLKGDATSGYYPGIEFYSASNSGGLVGYIQGYNGVNITATSGFSIYLDVNGNTKLKASSTGVLIGNDLIGTPTKYAEFTSTGLALGGMTFGTSAAGVIAIANGTAPSTSPAGGGQLYVISGELWYRGSSGTTTKLAVA